ncbi:resistance protein [Musa troglodytarum]|uniref:Resistance protein n=1 Tax=Musa troglodytarum TaxID=320322 RepID=A0A9E7KAS9_9LILI|nr:resistance protein [Musa troglodytarum]
MAGVDLRHVLLDLLPSSDMTERCRELRIHHHLEKIILDLWAINAVIRDATIRAGTQPDVEMWMADAGAAIADVQNLLDRILEWPGRAAAPSNPLLRSCLGIRVAFRLSILQELKEMGRRSKELVRRGSALDLRKEAMDAMDPCDEDYSHVLGEEVVGRDKDRDNIIEILQQKQSSSNGEPFVIVIRDRWSWMGKTTVARMIYHHPWVRQHFHHRIWVDVSMDLYSDPVSIGREFARCITGESCDHLRSHQAMWLLVNERLGQRRYLLILNDVYHDVGEEGLLKGKWDELKHKLLHVGGMGSTVIITTKSASIFSRSLDTYGCRDYLLAGLSEEVWIKLVMREALIGSEQDNTRSINFLLQFAEQQYETLEGSPLVAKTLGSTFRNTEVRRWQQVADALSSYSDVTGHPHFELMSLQILSTKPARLQLYRSLCNLRRSHYFKKDYMHMMIAEDLMPQQSFDAEKMYRLVPQLELEFETLGSDYYLTTRMGQDSIRIPEQCCHLCLLVGDASIFPTALSSVGGIKRLRTLILQTDEELVEEGKKCQIREIPAAMFRNLVHLRILYLSHCRIQQLPHTIGKLVCLRYLNLSYTEIQALPKHLSRLQNLKILKLVHCEEFRKLPESIHKLKKLLILKLAYCQKLRMLPESIIALTNLQELDIEGCQWFVKLPEGLDSMKKLTMLNVDKCVSLTRLPHGIGQLTDLQNLSVYVTADSLASVTLELQSLVNLKKLRLRKLDGLSSREDARAFKLKDKRFLKRLALSWEWWDTEVALATNAALLLHEQVLEDLQPTLALINLEIVSYMGKKLPSWMTRKQGYLKHLREIKLVNLRKCERLPPLGQLLGLETIEISGMDSISAVDDAFYGDGRTFESLRSLIFSEMPMLERWVKPKGEGDMFPRLRRLMLIQCPKFKELHVRLPSQWRLTLSVWLNNDKLLSSEFVGWQKLEGVRWLEISGCEELRCLPPGLKHLEHLRRLEIVRCNNLTSLPDWLAQLNSLENLILRDCAMLRCLPPGLKHLERLRRLEIIRCNSLISLPDWLAQLTILDLSEGHRIPLRLIVRDCALLA